MSPARDVHPVADLFPMLGPDELADLAADIAERGLLHPIVLDVEGRILDGRNRLAACEKAEVVPEFVTYEGGDPDGYALAVNGQRRDMSKSRKAQVAAQSLLVTNTSAVLAAKAIGVSQALMAKAVTVREHAPDLASEVIAGVRGLDEAWGIARERKTAADSAEAQLARLREEDPELADKVVEGELTLPGAWAEQRARAAQRDSERRAAVNNLRSVLTYLVSESIAPSELAKQDYAVAVAEYTQEDLDYAATTMLAIADMKRMN
jgi:ParB-like chromosome segregation protein Spo0J